MRIELLYFGILQDFFATSSHTVELPTDSTVDTLLNLLQESTSNRFEAWSTLAVAVNREYAQPSTVLHDGDEVALLPPVSGGAQGQECG
jgi:molybdopterin converting factor subunit 1